MKSKHPLFIPKLEFLEELSPEIMQTFFQKVHTIIEVADPEDPLKLVVTWWKID